MNTIAKIATICQSGNYFPTVEENRRAMLKRLSLALKHKPDLVCLPETFCTPTTQGGLENKAETLPGATTDEVTKLARLHNCYVICPIFTQRQGRFWNTAVIIDRKGDIMGVYDKLHPVTSSSDYTTMEDGITPGAAAPVFELDFGRIGVQICFDIHFPETWAALAQKGARAVFWASAYNGGFPLQAYAWLYHYYVISAVSTEKARIIDPCGTILAETDYQNNIVVREINLDFAVCHYDFNYSLPDCLQEAYPGRVEIRTHWDAGHFLVEPREAGLTISHLKEELGFIDIQEYIQHHQNAYTALRAGQTPLAQKAAHGDRPMYSK